MRFSGRDGRSGHGGHGGKKKMMEYFEASGPTDDCSVVPAEVKMGDPTRDADKWCEMVRPLFAIFWALKAIMTSWNKLNSWENIKNIT